MTAYLILALVALQRATELIIDGRNTCALLARGGVEFAPQHYPLLIVLHVAWLVTIVVMLPSPATIHWFALGPYLVLQALRAWTLLSLGQYWTTRIISLPNAPLVGKGPYHFLRHPNYWIVVGEVALLPLVFAETWVAITFTVLNALLIGWRIRKEDEALAPRRIP